MLWGVYWRGAPGSGRVKAAGGAGVEQEDGAVVHGQVVDSAEAVVVVTLDDGDVPHSPGGAIASARSVAEVLRCYVEDVMDVFPAGRTPPRIDVAPAGARDEGTVKLPT